MVGIIFFYFIFISFHVLDIDQLSSFFIADESKAVIAVDDNKEPPSYADVPESQIEEVAPAPERNCPGRSVYVEDYNIDGKPGVMRVVTSQ